MDEHHGPPPCEDSLAETTARMLETLRAETAELRAQEEARWGELESRLTRGIETIEAEIVEQQEAVLANRADADAQTDQLSQLHDDFRGEQQELAQYLQEMQDRLAVQEEELAKREQLVSQSEEAQRQAEKLIEEGRVELDRSRERLTDKESSLDRQVEQHADDRQRLKEQRQVVGEKLRDQRQQQQAALEQERAALLERLAELDLRVTDVARREEELDRQTAAIAEQVGSLDSDDADGSLAVAIGHLQDDLNARNSRVAELEQLLQKQESDLSTLRDQQSHHEQELANASKNGAAHHEAFARLADLQESHDALSGEFQTLQEQLEEMSRERDILRKDVATATDTRDALADALAETECQLTQVREQLAAQPDPSELQAKFELAIEEARDLRAQNAELEEELTSLRSVDSKDSNELADLQNERDALHQQLQELQNHNASQPDGVPQQEFNDLRQRFEMAVDDVRLLKTEKADLEQKLSEQARANRAHGNPAEDLDWAAMKDKLMASLEEDYDPNREADRQERTTIEGTIRITDDIIAEKEREIVELKGLLENQMESIGDVAVGAGAVAELFDQDESIREERERLLTLQSELEDKLRESELELSVQRAKFSRDQNALDQRQEELEELRAEIREAANAIPTTDLTKPKRRWLARLGLNKEGEE